MEKFKKYFEQTYQEVETYLRDKNDSLKKNISTDNKNLTNLISCFNEGSKDGKRIRAILVKLGYELIKPADKKILQPAIAYECFQTGILAHDDIVDKSPLRRGAPSLYKALEDSLKDSDVLDKQHYGLSQAICLGDFGIAVSILWLLNSDYDENVKYKAINSYINALYRTVLGQMLDVELPYRPQNATFDSIIYIYTNKTAYYTIVGPLHLGLHLANAKVDMINEVEKFGKKMGIAFQIFDDINGMFSTEEEIGKSTSSDAEEGKITLLWHYAKSNASKEQQEVLKTYGTINASENIERIKEVFIQTGAKKQAMNYASQCLKDAKGIINSSILDYNNKDLLLGLIDLLQSTCKESSGKK